LGEKIISSTIHVQVYQGVIKKARWTGGMTILLSVKRVYDKGALENMDYPVTIYIYLIIHLSE
jgi:hypothetical protein